MKPELTEPDKDGPNITSPENLFRFQSSVIRRLAASETCIIVGRCGNYVLQDQMDNLVRIFVYADTVTRIRRVMDVDLSLIHISRAVAFGNATAAVKNTIPGDLPSSNLEEIETIIHAHNQAGPQSEMAR